MTYDFRRRRWYGKNPGTRWSNYVLGLLINSIHLIENGELVVSVYKGQGGDIRYSRPITAVGSVAGPNVLYRIRVKLKKRKRA